MDINCAITRGSEFHNFCDLGAPWLGKIPAHWKMVRLKYGFDIIGSGTTPPTGEASYYDGDVPWVTTSELRENVIETTNQRITRYALNELTALRVYPVGSVLFAMYGATIGRVALLGIEATVNQAVCVLAYSSLLNSRFAFYVLQASRDDLVSSAAGGGQPNLNAERVREHRVACPPMAEQCAIADYLNREMARLDALMAGKKRLLNLLVEKRRALITRAVTRGLDPNVPLRDSGIPWLGEIPAHWEVTLLRFACCSIETGGTPSIDYVDDPDENSVDWFTPSDFGSDLVLRESVRRLAQEAVLLGEAKLFPAGSVFVVGIGATLGKVGIIEAPASANQQINAMIPRGNVEPHFLAHVLWMLGDVMAAMANSATLPILNQQRMGEIRVPIPPVSEQRTIVSAVASEAKRIESVWVAAEHTISLLKERRSALIAAAVTGQIDVRSRP